MQLTKQTDFAFRVLLYLGKASDGRLVNVRDICQYYDISQHHVAKVVVKLTKLGYVESVRGAKGGIRLARLPDTINVSAVVRDFETTLQPVNCSQPKCVLVPGCKLRGVLFEAMEAFLSTTADYTLADLL